MTSIRLLWVIALLSTTALAQADQTLLGDIGESCRARSDCRTGLKCVANVCHEEQQGKACGSTSECGGQGLRCIAQVCRMPGSTSSVGPAGPPPPPPPAPDEVPLTVMAAPEMEHAAGDVLEGTRWYAGAAPGLGLSAISVRGWGSGGGVALPLSFRAGVWLGRFDLQLDFSPATNLFIGTGIVPNLQLNFNAGYFAPFTSSAELAVGWVFRLGLGFTAIGVNGVQARAQLIGIGVRKRHFGFEVGLPLCAYVGLDGAAGAATAPLTVGFTYLF